MDTSDVFTGLGECFDLGSLGRGEGSIHALSSALDPDKFTPGARWLKARGEPDFCQGDSFAGRLAALAYSRTPAGKANARKQEAKRKRSPEAMEARRARARAAWALKAAA